MDWLSTDLMEIKDKTGKKSNYLIIVDRASAFARAYNLQGTKTKNIITFLEEFVETYYGPLLLLTSDGGPQFGAANRAITEWVNKTGINHELSSSYSPQSNREAEAAIKRIKYIIQNTDGTPKGIKTVCHNINWEQRSGKSGAPAELFLNRASGYPGLAIIPHKLIDSCEERRRRKEGRKKQIEGLKKNLRDPDVFENGEIVYIQDENGKWTIRCIVLNRRKNQGVSSASYMLKKTKQRE